MQPASDVDGQVGVSPQSIAPFAEGMDLVYCTSRLLAAQAAQRRNGGGAAGQAEAAPGSDLLHRQLSEKEKEAVSLLMEAEQSWVRARRSEEASSSVSAIGSVTFLCLRHCLSVGLSPHLILTFLSSLPCL